MENRHIKRFTPEQMEILAANPFTHEITPRNIYHTLEFKNLFLARYEKGDFVKDIFTSLGYDTAILGENRIYSFSKRLLRKIKAGKALTEESQKAKQEKPVNVDYNTMPAQQAVSAMQREIAYLRQQVEFLKKITELGNDRKLSK